MNHDYSPQDGQYILTATPSVIKGYRLKVYRAEGTTQWFSAITSDYNEEERVSSDFKFGSI